VTLATHEWFFLGAAAGWIVCALCFMAIPTWRVRDIKSLSDEELDELTIATQDEWIVRHPTEAEEIADDMRRFFEGEQ